MKVKITHHARVYGAAIGAVALALTAVVASQSYSAQPNPASTSAASLARFDSQQPAWSPCPGLPTAPGNPVRTLQCATIKVPLDYSAPAGKTISVELSRLPAADQQHKKGTMLVMPGGPGVPGVPYPLSVNALDSGHLGQSYDLVGFDQRGVGGSTPITCGLDTTQALYDFFPVPSPQGIGPDAQTAKSIAEDCEKNAGDYLPHLNTMDTARDLEVIRNVLGLPQFAYLGDGYASTLAVDYMSQFPGRISAAVFDSLRNYTVSLEQSDLNSAPAFEARFDTMATELAKGNAGYGLGATQQAVQQTYLDELTQLDKQAEQLAGVSVDGYQLRDLMYGSMYVEQAVPLFGTVLSALVHHQNEAQAAQLVQALNTLPTLEGDALNSSMNAIGCSSTSWGHDILVYQIRIAVYSALYPVGGAGLANISACAFWPVQATGPLPQVDRNGPRNILILQSTTDPITDYQDAVVARTAMGPRARMVSVNMAGTGVLTTGLPCPTGIMDSFLINGVLPSEDTTCS